jgi:SAM-dependent methyltransferase
MRVSSQPIFFRNFWARLFLRGVHFRDRHRQLNALYRLPNPWNLDDPKERFRFEQTNNLIKNEFGRVHRLFEIGCGEGHQSVYLAETCDRLRGCDVSARAIERARRRCPNCEFVVGPFNPHVDDDECAYDLVVACEVLYYMQDVEAALNRMSRMGAACLVTYYKSQAARLDPVFAAMGLNQSLKIVNGEDWWTATWWRNG